MLVLHKLGFCIVYVDEFTVNDKTHHNYNWVNTKENTGVVVANRWRSLGCIAAVTKKEVLKI